MATAILFNLGRMWSDDEPEDEDGEGGDRDEEPSEDNFIVEDENPNLVRERGQAERLRLFETMIN